MGPISKTRKLLLAAKVDAALITHLPHIRWAVGFSGSNGLLYVDSKQAIFVTDGRYRTQAAEEVKDAEIIIADQHDLIAPLKARIAERGRLGVTPEYLTVADH